MYEYRRMDPDERRRILQERKDRGFPLHAPPHFAGIPGEYLITAACYEHRHIFAAPDDLTWLGDEVLHYTSKSDLPCSAWAFLPNHYHILLGTQDLALVSETLRLLHSRIATAINGRQGQRGRQVWYRYNDRLIRGERHHLATVNYIHYNPIKHGHVDLMRDWPWSSIHKYVETKGEDWILQTWRDYPLGDYGKGWDW